MPGQKCYQGARLHRATGANLWFRAHVHNYTTVGDLTWIGDQNGDGYPDLAVAMSTHPLPDRCLLLDGRTGAELSRITGAEPDEFISVFSLGDVNGDGYQDLFLHWNEYDLRVYSGAPGHPMLYRL